MCLIIFADKGSDKKDKFLKEAIIKASEFNGDGMGYAIKRADNSIYLSKGFFDVNRFIKDIEKKKVKEEDELLIHLRIGNKGLKKAINMCHPFVVSEDEEEVLNTNKGSVNKPVVAHNGTMFLHSVYNSDKSDTFYFIKNILSKQPVLNLLRDDIDVSYSVLKPHLGESRMCIMYPDDHASQLLGKWHTIKGFYFSKDYYKEYFPIKTNFNNRKNNNYEQTKLKLLSKGSEDWNDLEKDFNTIMDSNDIVQIPDLAYNRPFFEDFIGEKYYLYMGLYIPTSASINKYVVSLNNDNFDSAIIKPTSNSFEHHIYRSCSYIIEGVGNSYMYLHNETDNYDIELKIRDFYELFDVSFNNLINSYYEEYFELVKDLKPSKSLIKKLNNSYNRAIEDGLDLVNFYHNNQLFSYVDVEMLGEFITNLEEELDLQKNPHKLLF